MDEVVHHPQRIERSNEDLELQNFEQRERIEYLEAQVAHMLASGYNLDGFELRPDRPPLPPTPPPQSAVMVSPGAFPHSYLLAMGANGVQPCPWNIYPGD